MSYLRNDRKIIVVLLIYSLCGMVNVIMMLGMIDSVIYMHIDFPNKDINSLNTGTIGRHIS